MTRTPQRVGRRSACVRPARPGHTHGEDGGVSYTFILLLWLTVVAGVAIVDVGAYLVAAARAQQLADAAALAAVSVDAERGAWNPGPPAPVEPGDGSPLAAARRIVEAGDGRLEDCACAHRREAATVTVSVPVHGVFIPRKAWAQRLTAEASAELVDARPP